MPTDDGDPASDALAARAALDEALAPIAPEDRVDVPDRVAHRILGVGLRLGLERPSEARHLLGLIEATEVSRSTAPDGAAADVVLSSVAGPGASAAPADIPICSRLLAQAAAVSDADLVNEDPASRFGWAARLTREEVLALGRVVDDMLAAGATPDIARGFGLAWDGGVRIPRKERNDLFPQFAGLEVTVGGVLEGRDLRADRGTARATGLEGLFASWLSRPRLGDASASAAIERAGDPARRGLVALWNAWAAMRFRSLIPRPTFELLVEPWVTVVGPLPER